MTDNHEGAAEGASWPPVVPPDAKAAAPAFDEAPPDKLAFLRIAILMSLTVGINTLAGTFSGEKINYLMKDELNLTAAGMAVVGIITGLGDYMRPFIGSLSDIVPIFGYHRRSYYAIGSLVSALGYACLGLEHTPKYAPFLVILTFMGAGGTMLMIMADAVMVKVGNRTGTVGVLQSIQQFVPSGLAVLGLAHMSGYVTTHWSDRQCFLTAAVTSLFTFPLFLLIDERRVIAERQQHETAAEHEERNRQKLAERQHTLTNLKTAAKSIELWAIVGFVFYLIFTPSVNNAQFMYQVNYLHFTKQQIGNLGSPGASGTMVGIILFGIASRFIPVRPIVWGAWLLDCLTYVILYGIHDYASAWMVTFISGVLGIIYTLCLFTLAARACPPGIEGTVYGLVISAISLSGALGEWVGDNIFDKLGGTQNLTIVHAWHESLIIGLLVTIPAVIFIPFLPKWTRSNELLKSPTVHEPKPA